MPIEPNTLVPEIKRRKTRSWKTEAQSWEHSYRRLVRWELWAVSIAAGLGLGLGWLVGWVMG